MYANCNDIFKFDGKKGIKKLAEINLSKTFYLKKKLAEKGILPTLILHSSMRFFSNINQKIKKN